MAAPDSSWLILSTSFFGRIMRGSGRARLRCGRRAGRPTEAVYIFHNMLKRLQRVYKPEYLAAIFESEGPTFRDAGVCGL